MTVQNTSDFDFETGLEDFTMEDAVTPRLKIIHKQALFEDTLSRQQFNSINCIMLGLVKQRILWHHKIDDNASDSMPMCKSNNHDIGFPLTDEEVPASKRFPWELSGFDPAAFTPDEEGLIHLPCEGCKLKDWGSHPMGDKPYCAEQFTTPVLYDSNGDGSAWVPAIISFQKSSLSPLKAYFTGFQRARNAAFMAITEISLELRKRGDNEYSVPNFRKVGETEDTTWRAYSAQYRQMRDFLTQDPGIEDLMPSENPPTQETPVPGTVDQDGVEEAQIVEEPPAQEPSTPAPAAPPAPEASSAPAAPVAPSQPSPLVAPAVPAAAAPAADDDDDGLPF
jgi:hypothetical protein